MVLVIVTSSLSSTSIYYYTCLACSRGKDKEKAIESKIEKAREGHRKAERGWSGDHLR